MFFDSDEFLFSRVRCYCFRLGFIEKTQLSLDIIRAFFAGLAKELLCKIVYLLLQYLLALIGSIDHSIEVFDRFIEFFYGIFELYDLLIPRILCHLMPPKM